MTETTHTVRNESEPLHLALPSMRAFYQSAREQLEQEWAAGQELKSCPVFFNITNFRLYNASCGIEEGDHCLQQIAEILRKNFPGRLLTHLGADHFAVLAATSDVTERIESSCHDLQSLITNPNIELKAGIRYLNKPLSNEALTLAFDNDAALACKSISKDATRHYAVYTKEMGRIHQLQNYVRENLDKALASHHIKVYCQPIVRSLNGKVCSCEALARWDSPEYGLLSPALFIPTLEEARLIDRLDRYVVEQMARRLHSQLKQGQPVLPISINFSRLDFQLMDPVRLLEDTLTRYQLPRNLLYPEVTENALVLQDDSIRQGLCRFRKAGFKVWLDDFGSGYSSLNVLKDYHFHTLKLDMAFLHPFTKESRTILTAIVRMAKELGVHTLAEGVETREQAQFLRDIGCEKLQGYYFGRPLPAAECRPYCRDRNLSFETLPEAVLLDKAGLIDVSQSSPVAIVYDDSQTLQFLQANAGYLQALQSMGTRNVSDSNQFLSSLDFPMHQKFRRFADRARKSGQQETMTYVDNGQYMRVNLRTVAQVGHHCIHRAELYNISLDEEARDRQSRHFDTLLRNIILTYEGVWYLDLEHKVLEIIVPLTADQQTGTVNGDIDGTFRHFTDYFVHPRDRQRFLAFVDRNRFHQRAAASQCSVVREPFRILRSNGNFEWLIITGLALPKSPKGDILFYITKLPVAHNKAMRPILLEMLQSNGITTKSFDTDRNDPSSTLWQTFLRYSREKVVWKDHSHRIMGASRAFSQWVGIPQKDLLGKTVEDLGICVNRQETYEADEEVLRIGHCLTNRVFHFVISHMPHRVQVDRFPLYQNDRITGIALCFHDLDEEENRPLEDMHAAVTDEETGFLNYRGMVMAGLRYADTFRLYGDDYTATLIDVPEFDAIGLTYGQEFRRHLLQKVTGILTQYLPSTITISHIGSCCFLLFQKSTQIAQLREAHVQMANAIHEIQQVDGFPCTLYMHYAIVRGSEARSLDSLLQLLIKRMRESEEGQYGQALYTGDRFIFDREAFDSTDLSVVVSDPDTHDLLYCNPAMRKRSGIPLDAPLNGLKCYEQMAGLSAPCPDCCEPRLRCGRFISRVFHNPVAGADFLLRDTLIPWHGKNCHFSTCLNLDDYLVKDTQFSHMLSVETSVNDAIRLGMYETDPVHGIRQMMSRIGRQLGADRILLAEETGDTVTLTYVWEADGIIPLGKDFQPIPRRELRPVFDQFSKNSTFSIPDMTAYWKANPDLSPHVPGLKRVALARLMLDGQPYGFIDAINPAEDKFHLAEELLSSLTRFFAILLRNRDLMQRLDRLSKSDQLTGLLNRRGFKDCLAALPENRQYAFVFGDLNGLKKANDTEGHEAGDQLIVAAADVFRHVGQTDFIFRMGGDEFLMIQEIRHPEDANALVNKLEAHFQTAGISIALGCTTAASPIDDIDTVLTRADALMYRQKSRQRHWKFPKE